ncbi:MAG: LysR family transcriptional regulator [Pseudomonadota bacterium]|nr:LysR family transcriptional regulator [Pseudomonadota bacterium]
MTNLQDLDLNLLAPLEALLAERSVSRAADRLGLSQPATSHALRRLREALGDPLLVRSGAGMTLTPRAESLRAPLAAALESVRGVFEQTCFDPATTQRRFVVMMPDVVLGLIVPPLIERTSREAPDAVIQAIPLRGPSAMTHELEEGVDAVISCAPDDYPGFRRQRLYTDSDALAVRRGHPQARRLSRAEVFASARHVAVIGIGRREDMIEEWLRANGLARRIAFIASTYMQALHVAAKTDLVAFVPSRLIAVTAGDLGLVAARPPLDPGVDEQFLFYPARMQGDPASIWLRGLILDIARDFAGRAAARR